jgi:nucleotide-binding universal stress UspA family protein
MYTSILVPTAGSGRAEKIAEHGIALATRIADVLVE